MIDFENYAKLMQEIENRNRKKREALEGDHSPSGKIKKEIYRGAEIYAERQKQDALTNRDLLRENGTEHVGQKAIDQIQEQYGKTTFPSLDSIPPLQTRRGVANSTTLGQLVWNETRLLDGRIPGIGPETGIIIVQSVNDYIRKNELAGEEEPLESIQQVRFYRSLMEGDVSLESTVNQLATPPRMEEVTTDKGIHLEPGLITTQAGIIDLQRYAGTRGLIRADYLPPSERPGLTEIDRRARIVFAAEAAKNLLPQK